MTVGLCVGVAWWACPDQLPGECVCWAAPRQVPFAAKQNLQVQYNIGNFMPPVLNSFLRPFLVFGLLYPPPPKKKSSFVEPKSSFVDLKSSFVNPKSSLDVWSINVPVLKMWRGIMKSTLLCKVRYVLYSGIKLKTNQSCEY
jgi:hypothetical protein